KKKPKSFRIKPGRVFSRGNGSFREEKLLANKFAGFALHKLSLTGKGSVIFQLNKGRFSVLTILQGEVMVQTAQDAERREGWSRVKAGTSVLIPAFVKRYQVRSETPRALLLKSFVPL